MSPEVPTDMPMKRMNLYETLNHTLESLLEKDEEACIFGEDVGFGGVFHVTRDLQNKFGE
jgi:2-oxoisovalerate dehydrogenase E1 component beta subunit